MDFIALSYIDIINAQVLNEKYNAQIQNRLECHHSIIICTNWGSTSNETNWNDFKSQNLLPI